MVFQYLETSKQRSQEILQKQDEIEELCKQCELDLKKEKSLTDEEIIEMTNKIVRIIYFISCIHTSIVNDIDRMTTLLSGLQ